MGFWTEDIEVSSENVGGKEVGMMEDVPGREMEIEEEVVEV